MSKKYVLFALIVACLVMTLAGCSGEQVEKTGAVLKVADTEYYESEISAMEQVTITTAHPKSGEMNEYSGVRLLVLLDDAGVSVDTITVVASDGYEKEITTADIPQDGLVVIDEGMFRLVMPDMSSSAWVKNVVEIR